MRWDGVLTPKMDEIWLSLRGRFGLFPQGNLGEEHLSEVALGGDGVNEAGHGSMVSAKRIDSDSRRRRVLIYQSCCGDEATTAVDRRKAEQLRKARKEPATYGANVNRRLRGRWFSLVPVKRRAIAAVGFVLLLVVASLGIAHWAANYWQPLAQRPEVARPFYLDRPDSFGTWVRALFLAAAAGTATLIYQLRRYRNDDYRGSYRMWPPVIILIAIGSVDAVAGLFPWLGELIQWGMGRRVVVSGGDWMRMLLSVGGLALGVRILIELRSSKLALASMAIGSVFFAIPLLAQWEVLKPETQARWFLITTSPLIAAAALWFACAAYLRKLFREVRGIDAEDSLSRRFVLWKEQAWGGDEDVDSEEDEAPTKGAAKNDKSTKVPSAKSADKPVPSRVTTNVVKKKSEGDQTDGDGEGSAEEVAASTGRGWFRFGFLRRGRKVQGAGEGASAASATSAASGTVASKGPVPKETSSKETIARDSGSKGPAVGSDLKSQSAAKPAAPVPAPKAAAKSSEGEDRGAGDAASGTVRPKRNWFGWLRRGKAPGDSAAEGDAKGDTKVNVSAGASAARNVAGNGATNVSANRTGGNAAASAPNASAPNAGASKGPLATAMRPGATGATSQTASGAGPSNQQPGAEGESAPGGEKRKWFGGWFGKKSKTEGAGDKDGTPGDEKKPETAAKPLWRGPLPKPKPDDEQLPDFRPIENSADDDDDMDDDGDDNSSRMSRADKKRLRREMRRGGNAA